MTHKYSHWDFVPIVRECLNSVIKPGRYFHLQRLAFETNLPGPKIGHYVRSLKKLGVIRKVEPTSKCKPLYKLLFQIPDYSIEILRDVYQPKHPKKAQRHWVYSDTTPLYFLSQEADFDAENPIEKILKETDLC